MRYFVVTMQKRFFNKKIEYLYSTSQFLPVADNCEVELDFFPIPVLFLGERSWSTTPLLRSVAVSDKLPSEKYVIYLL